MTALNQDFSVFRGDAAYPQFTVSDGAGTPINISTVTEITWIARRDLQSAPVLTKTKTGGGISLISGGTTGIFQLALAPADTNSLSGFYVHSAQIVDASNNPTTVTLGRFQVGAAPLWSYSGDPSTSDKDAVRFLMGDTKQTDQQVMDGEILYALTQGSSVLKAAAIVCRSLAAQLARQADVVDRDLRTSLSQRSRAYLAMANQFDVQASSSSFPTPFAGGISLSDKRQQEMDTDRVQPNFNIGMEDNYLPVAPVGNEPSPGVAQTGDTDE